MVIYYTQHKVIFIIWAFQCSSQIGHVSLMSTFELFPAFNQIDKPVYFTYPVNQYRTCNCSLFHYTWLHRRQSYLNLTPTSYNSVPLSFISLSDSLSLKHINRYFSPSLQLVFSSEVSCKRSESRSSAFTQPSAERRQRPPAVRSMSPGLSTPTDHRAATAPSSISPTQSLIITPQQTPQEAAVPPECTRSEARRGTAARGLQKRRQKAADVPRQDTR